MNRPDVRRTAYLTVSGVDAMGTGMFLPISVLFFVNSRHLSAVAVGTALTAASVLGLALAPLGAQMIERWGAGRVLVISYLGKAVASAAYLFVGSPLQFFFAALLARSVSQWSQPAQLMMASSVARDGQRIRLLATSRALRNVAMSAGSGIAALLLFTSPTYGGAVLVATDAASYVLAAALAVLCLPSHTAARADAGTTRSHGPSWGDVLLRQPRYLRAALTASLLSLQTPLLMVALPLTAQRVTTLSGSITAIAITVNTVAVALLQVTFSHKAEEVSGAIRSMRFGSFAMAMCCVPLAFSVHEAPFAVFCLLALVFLLANTLSELWISAGSWGVALGLSPPDSARHLTVYSSFESVGSAVGAGLTAVVIGSIGVPGWWLFGGIGLLAASLTWTLQAKATTTRNGTEVLS